MSNLNISWRHPRLVLRLFAVAATALVAGCGSYGGGGTTTKPVTIQISPATVTVQTGHTQQFTASVTYAANSGVIWQINGVTGGNTTVGTISATGLYAAPMAVPTTNPVTVKAIAQADSTKSDTATVTIAPPVSVAVGPKTVTVVTGLTQQFTATVTNTANTAVTWQVNGVTGGNATVGTISTSGLYTAPAAVPPVKISVAAISQADSTRSDTATVTVVLPVSVTVSPKAPSVQVGLTQQFAAAVTNTSNTAVTWQVNGVTGGDSTHGTINASGLYTAPAAVPNPATVTVKAISVAANTRFDTATVTVTPAPVIVVTVSPTTPSVQVSATQQFTATVTNTPNTAVTWQVNGVTGGNATVGTISATGLYTAPSTVPSPAAITITAVSVVDTTKSASATVTLVAPPVITSGTTANGTVGNAFSYQITATNTPTSYGATGLPGGLTVNTGTGLISGTPTAAGTTNVTISATNGAGTGTATLTLTIAASTPITISPRTAALTFSQTQQFTTNATGASWSVDGVVGGSAATGSISGSGLYTPPGSAGTHTVTVTSADHSNSASAAVYITNYAGKFTHQNDNGRTGQNLNETVLTPLNVNQTQFGKLFSYPLDGNAYASPLYVANVNIPGLGIHNVVYVATQHDSVYAFDADGRQASPLWKVSFINPPAVTTVSMAANPNLAGLIDTEVGITGTPVIDQATSTLYVVVNTAETSNNTTNYVQKLHALDITTGNEKFGGPVSIQATVNGIGGPVQYQPLTNLQRPALLLSNGVVYVASGSFGDIFPYNGWILGYNAQTLQQVMAFCTTPDRPFGGGIWQSGGGPAADSGGSIYFVTGNGTFDINTGGRDYGDTFVKLNPNGTVTDYFTPHNQSDMETLDLDLGSAGVLLLPDQPAAVPHLVGTAGKSGTIFVVNRDNMGHYNPNNDNQIVQEIAAIFPNGSPEPGNFIPPVYFNGNVYFSPINDTLQAFSVTNDLLSTSPTSRSSAVYSYPGGGMAISANNTAEGILWTVQNTGSSPGVLHAYDALNLATELYNSSQSGTRDTLDRAIKFTIPAVANGKVFVGGYSNLVVYGLLP